MVLIRVEGLLFHNNIKFRYYKEVGMIDNPFLPLRLRLPHGVDRVSGLVPRLNTKSQSCPEAVASDSVNFKVFPHSDDAGVADHAIARMEDWKKSRGSISGAIKQTTEMSHRILRKAPSSVALSRVSISQI